MTGLTTSNGLDRLSVLLLVAAIGAASLGRTTDPEQGPSPVWRFWSPVYSSHFYTISESEKDKLIADHNDVWVYEQVAFRAFARNETPGLKAVYRFWSDPFGRHLYTLDEEQRCALMADPGSPWAYEGLAFYVYPPQEAVDGTVAVQRYESDSLGNTVYTASQREMFTLANTYPDIWRHAGLAWYACPATASSEVTITKGPYLQNVGQNEITIMWETDVPADSWIEYDTGVSDANVVFDPALVTLHKMHLTGLEPDSWASYLVRSGQTFSQSGIFATAPAQARPFRFVVYGDSRVYSDVHAEVVRSIIRSDPEVVLHTGDLVNHGRDYNLWGPELFTPAEPLLRTRPFIPVVGNHEYYRYPNRPLWFFYFFDRPYERNWFAMSYGNTRFIILDTNQSYVPGSPQHDWLLSELTSTEYLQAMWRVVLFHHPAFTATSRYRDDPTVKRHLVPLFGEHGVDIVFQGHSHTYERYLHEGVVYIVTGGGSGPLYELTEDMEPPFRQFGLTINHHCTIDVDPAARTFTLRALDNDSRVFDTIGLTK